MPGNDDPSPPDIDPSEPELVSTDTKKELFDVIKTKSEGGIHFGGPNSDTFIGKDQKHPTDPFVLYSIGYRPDELSQLGSPKLIASALKTRYLTPFLQERAYYELT